MTYIDRANEIVARIATAVNDETDYSVTEARRLASEIARHLGISSASTTALLDRLEKAGMVVRGSNPEDRRSILISVTDDAEHAIASTYEVFEARLAGLMPIAVALEATTGVFQGLHQPGDFALRCGIWRGQRRSTGGKQQGGKQKAVHARTLSHWWMADGTSRCARPDT